MTARLVMRRAAIVASCSGVAVTLLWPMPALIVSPFAKQRLVDHTLYDTTSILSLITRRFALPRLPGLARRNAAVAANGGPPLGDLTNALDLTRP